MVGAAVILLYIGNVAGRASTYIAGYGPVPAYPWHGCLLPILYPNHVERWSCRAGCAISGAFRSLAGCWATRLRGDRAGVMAGREVLPLCTYGAGEGHQRLGSDRIAT